MYNESDNLAVGYALGRDANDSNNGWGDGAGWLWIIVLFALFGWGGNGFGGFGGNGARYATQGDVQRGFDTSTIVSKLDGISNGLCDGFYAVNTSLLNGFNSVNTNILTSANATQSGITNLGYQLQSCCCDIERGIDRLACQSATDTAAIIQAGSNNTQRILDYLCNEKISGLQAENAALTAQLSQNAQTRTLIDTLLPVARPAYITCSPYESSFGFGYGRNGYGNSGCGCNSCGL